MNMMDSPKFRRKRTSATAHPPAAAPASPYAAVKAASQEAAHLRVEADERARAEAETQRIAKAAERAKFEEKARRKAEFEERAQTEALRRVKAAREQRAADAMKAREDAERQESARQHREAEEARSRQEAAAKAAQDAEDHRQQVEKRAAEEAARREKAKRDAEARDADARRTEEDARRKAQPPAPVLPLTDMIPVTRRAEPAPTTAPVTPTPKTIVDVEHAWSGLPELTVDKAHLARNRIITATREDPAHGAFDVLRTRLLQTLSENGWRRVAITSPGKDCGKTFTAANLAISLSRQENCRTLLMDLDMRRPSLHHVLGVGSPGSVGDMLRGMIPPETHLHRMGRNPINAGRNIAFALNDRPEAYASELLQDPRSAETLRAIDEHYAPDVVLFDLPPALFYDDVIAARPLFDGVLLVVGGGLTTESEISEVERRLGDSMPVLGMVLNKAEGTDISRYTY
ncbi:putative tyrosine-protein kinase YveL [Antarctobacter heliothermus]|uniref:Putative tyrosine-protein kinase YveL n=1 Tax=Antarctobacter heliothermus TaxID=74033 RepID=A0A222E077_9RHOB|nr:exopolysaccharide biosynthesis protein [Antarctobacter heliothermus]ASP19590.1 putative tyrosine-protein kinase YveL [Antarctobacter heliothermus]